MTVVIEFDSTPTGRSFVNFLTCPDCLSTSYREEMRDAHWPAPRRAFGRWRVCDSCGREWPVTGPTIFDRGLSNQESKPEEE